MAVAFDRRSRRKRPEVGDGAPTGGPDASVTQRRGEGKLLLATWAGPRPRKEGAGGFCWAGRESSNRPKLRKERKRKRIYFSFFKFDFQITFPKVFECLLNFDSN
jgi:hypothetical protein